MYNYICYWFEVMTWYIIPLPFSMSCQQCMTSWPPISIFRCHASNHVTGRAPMWLSFLILFFLKSWSKCPVHLSSLSSVGLPSGQLCLRDFVDRALAFYFFLKRLTLFPDFIFVTPLHLSYIIHHSTFHLLLELRLYILV